MDVSQTLGNFGARYTLDWRDRTLQFSFIGDVQKSWYETWMKQSLMEEIQKDRTSTESQKTDERIRVKELIYCGTYKWGGKKFNEIQNTTEGRLRLFWMLLFEKHPELRRTDILNIIKEKPDECNCILALTAADSYLESEDVDIPDEKKEVAYSKIYAQLTQPPEAGGLGIPIHIVAQYTDRQKMKQLAHNLRENKPDVVKRPLAEKDREWANDKLREIAQSQSLSS